MKEKLTVPAVYVIHVRGHQERDKHMRAELGKHGIDFQYMLDGNVEDMTNEIVERYFKGDKKQAMPGTSCTLKHLYVYEKMIEDDISGVLVFEDDIKLSSNFNTVFNSTMKEVQERGLENCIISYEHTTLKHVKKSELVDGQYLYEKPIGRCAGAYFLDLKAAKTIIDHLKAYKCDKIIDWYHNELIEKVLLKMYWSHPAIAEQYSHSGILPSLLDHKDDSIRRKIGWYLKKFIASARFS